MTDNEKARARISVLVDEIASVPADIRKEYAEEEDSEAYEIVRRIEKRLARNQAQAAE